MRVLILLVCLVVYSYAAPTSQQQSSNEHSTQSVLLDRPSPINPDIPSDPKPEEKITMITDPKEMLKYKREVVDDPYDHISRFAPTVPPAKQAEKVQPQEFHEQQHITHSDVTHNRQKREEAYHIIEAKKPAVAPSAVPTPASPKTAVKKDNPKHASQHNVPAFVPAVSNSDLPKARQRRQVDPHLIGASTVGFAPQIQTDDEEKRSQDEAVNNENQPEQQHVSETQPKEGDAQAASAVEHEEAKRDIPVPLVPKYHHPEESPKSGEKVADAQQSNSHHQSSAGHKGDKSSESDESDEDSEGKKPAGPLHTHQFVPTSVHTQEANGFHQQTATQHLPLHESNAETAVQGTPLVEADHHQMHQLFQSAIQPSNNLPHISTQHLTVDHPNLDHLPTAQPKVTPTPHETPVVPHETSVTQSENKPLEGALADIKQTKIIAYAPPANDDHLAIKHPVPVAELFSRPKK